jgi:hypothetical protein
MTHQPRPPGRFPSIPRPSAFNSRRQDALEHRPPPFPPSISLPITPLTRIQIETAAAINGRSLPSASAAAGGPPLPLYKTRARAPAPSFSHPLEPRTSPSSHAPPPVAPPSPRHWRPVKKLVAAAGSGRAPEPLSSSRSAAGVSRRQAPSPVAGPSCTGRRRRHLQSSAAVVDLSLHRVSGSVVPPQGFAAR